ncbi:helix-turn-helix domain-containing protein [Nocardioides mangrovi]|uniref:AraC family transcriptional regulator n=1 Tax=Nocardioides mangrovi TaxID=2874580 RepID=A0ABS7U6T7_9ACTN|nr:AraC family transcriptional regulator [Nocardioides mangrovi]MBZ5736689.1 AraC family transcriptional regulator [Nocardioides mangrovi]
MVDFAPAAVGDWDYQRTGAGVTLLLAHGIERGMTPRAVLAGSGLTGSDPVVTARQELRVVRNLQASLGEVGAEVGRCYRAATFGAFGYALLASATVLDAMNVALRFLDLSHTFVIPVAGLDGDRVRIVLDGTPLPADVRRFLVERDAAAIRSVLAELVEGGVPTRLVGSGAMREIGFDATLLDRPLRRSSPDGRALAEELCAGVVARRRDRSGLPAEVRVVVTQHLGRGAPMPEVAAALGLSERTLRRRLGDAGTSYRQLVDEVREALAGELLGSGRLLVADVAVRLGYAEATSFIAAHRRWTGATPRSRRRDATRQTPAEGRPFTPH